MQLSQQLNAGRITFAQWQDAVSAALERGGIDLTPLVAAAGLATGAALLRRTATVTLDQIAGRFTERVGRLAEALASGQIDVAAWRAAFALELDVLHTAAAIAGAGGSRDGAVYALGRQRALEQQAYLNAWAAALEADGLTSSAMLRSRSALYAGAARGTASMAQAQALGITLPHHPGDGRCRVNCRCFWDIRRVNGGFECRWVVDPAAESCPDCLEWGNRYNPLFIEVQTA